jgi:hypothetical protein
MQRKVRYGQDETARTWAVADWLADETPATEPSAPGREDWPQPS